MTDKATMVDAALKVLAAYDKADSDLAEAKLKMREVSAKAISSASARVIDLKGKTLMPGLIDYALR